MSILIKDLNIPKGEHERITVQIGSDGAVYLVTDFELKAEVYKFNAVEVPEPHGRLIDADKFKKIAKMDCEDCKTPNSDECLMCKEPAIEAIADLQPTVIEAEE